ncbi:MAG: DegV family protein [Roseburia sp.]|nr:DegV family protein [Roseburia sp.]
MRDFVISTDTAAGLPQEYLTENHIEVHPLHYIIDGVEYGMDLGRELTDKEFYDSIRNGKMPTTSATSPEYIGKLMRRQVGEGYDILHIGFSSGLSSSYEHAALCAQEIMQENPDCRIRTVDTLSAECGQALLVYKAVELKKQGRTLDEIGDWLEENKRHLVVQFTVEDLFHLVRGGRLSKSTAVLGTALNIQPILHVDKEGKLANIGKVRGRKKAMKTLVDAIEENSAGWEKDCVFLSHSDAQEEVDIVRAMVKEKYPDATVMTLSVSPTVGAHTGAGVLVIAYFGDEK